MAESGRTGNWGEEGGWIDLRQDEAPVPARMGKQKRSVMQSKRVRKGRQKLSGASEGKKKSSVRL